MYCSGAVRDYRFVYDLAPPTMHTLMAALQQQHHHQQLQLQEQQRQPRKQGPLQRRRQQQQPQQQQHREPADLGGEVAGEETLMAVEEEEGVEAALSQASSSSYANRSLQPLVPAACAMALLPRGGRMHAGKLLCRGCPTLRHCRLPAVGRQPSNSFMRAL